MSLDASTFVIDWSDNHKVNLQTATDAIVQLGHSATQQADRQEKTSNAYDLVVTDGRAPTGGVARRSV